MPFTADAVSSVSGRNSRASNVSAATANRSNHRSPPPISSSTNDTLNAGVLSMLKTSTDTGDIGALSFNSTRMPAIPGTTRGRRTHAHRSSISAQRYHSGHNYAPSQTSRVSSQWDAPSASRKGSLTSMQSMPPSLPPLHMGKPSHHMMAPNAEPRARDSRSYSMTSAPPGVQLPRHRSATSLKSQGHEPRAKNEMPSGTVTPMPENRAPFIYPTRLKRPGFRSPSPALSDAYGSGPPLGAGALPRQPPGPHSAQVGNYNRYESMYSGEYGHHLNVQPPQAPHNPPGFGFGPNSYAYQRGQIRQAPAMGMPHPMQQQYGPPYAVQHPLQQYPPQTQYGPQYPTRAGYSLYGPRMPPTHARRGPPPSNMAPMAHQMFHNAARMARQPPQRTDTPMTDGSPPSSDPPSSSSVPESSNPPTPKDHSTILVVVDPAFIDPALLDLPDSSSDPVLPNVKYFEYADGLAGHEEPEMEVAHPSVPPSGFVQRVKAMLESKAAAEAAVQHEIEVAASQTQHYHQYGLDIQVVGRDQGDISEVIDAHEMAANETPRFTIIEEFEAPVELPASPIRVMAELDASESTQGQLTRITRDMIRAELGQSSVDNTLQDARPDDSTAAVLGQLVEKGYDTKPDTPVEKQGASNRAAESHSRRSSHAASTKSNTRRQHSLPEAITEDSAEASLPTGMEYAMRFSRPADSSLVSDETQTRDPFALDADTTVQQDADTITLQRQEEAQQAREATKTGDPEDGKKTAMTRLLRESRLQDMTPISPLRSDDEANRHSAVSPLQLDVHGIDETLHSQLATQNARQSVSTGEQENADSLAAEDALPPPTPRTPKTYSKSVQLRPSVTVADTASSATNRFSLPGDLSTIGDSTLHNTSDMVTDVAVHFSLPQTTITIGKPQIINASPSSTPDKPNTDSALMYYSSKDHGLKERRRNSVTFADEIPPLNISKKPEVPKTSAESSSNKGKSIIRKPSPREDSMNSSNRDSQRTNSTTDLRFASIVSTNAFKDRFGDSHLPGLKEESIEDMGTPDSNCTSDPAGFALPARIAAVKAMQERRIQEAADKAKARRQARHQNRPLADTREIPSLNFSRVDLFEKLNDALEIKPTKSLEIIRHRDSSTIHSPSPQRPTSTEPLRERYMSFFSKPDEFGLLDDLQSETEDDYGLGHEPTRELVIVPTVQVQENTQIEDEEAEKHPGSRPLSPEDFLQVASQANRLSIPSVAGLSERLSELIPGLRNISSLRLDSIFGVADPQEMHPSSPGSDIGRPDTILTTRTSAGFRTLAERAEAIVLNGTHDSIAGGMVLKKDLPPLPNSASADEMNSASSNNPRDAYLSGSVSEPVDLSKERARPAYAPLGSKMPTTEEEVRDLLPAEMNPITRLGKRRSAILSLTNSRPWNVDQNYPWADTKIDIDLSVLTEAHRRNSFASEVLRQRKTKSLDIPSTPSQLETPSNIRGIDIGSITTFNPGDSSSITTEQLTGVSLPNRHHKSKHSIIGSISRRLKLTSGRNTALDAETTVKSPLSKSPVPPRSTSVISTNITHRPGDRYPTSSLTPPANFAIDEVRSFFSDNSSERDRTASFRKRLTHFRGKPKIMRTDEEGQARATSLDGGNTEYNAGSLNEQRAFGVGSAANTYDAHGMSKTEFHIKRFGEKLRHLFAKAGELARSISTRSRRPGGPRLPHDEWLADSLYSGV